MQQRRADHDVVLGAVHVAEGEPHQPVQDCNGVFGPLFQTHAENAVDPAGVALVADVVTVDAAGLAALLPVADGALHLDILVQIFKRGFADQTFLFHSGTSLVW